MQFSHLTIYYFCLLSAIYRWGYLLKATKEKDVQDCIVARVCVLTEAGRASDCAETVFTSQNAWDLGVHLSLETCVAGGQPLPDIGWFMEQPEQRWIAPCWNKRQCQIAVEGGSRQVWISIVLRMSTEVHKTLVPQACSVTVTSLTGQVSAFHGDGRGLGCREEGSVGSPADGSTGPVLWTLPDKVQPNFHTRTTQERQEEGFLDRGKRDTEGEEVDFLNPASNTPFRLLQPDVKDIIFSDISDSSDMFTGELTPDEQVWSADLPDTLNPVMTFPDDYMARMPVAGMAKKMQEQEDMSKQKLGLSPSVLPPVKELPQFSPTNNLLPMKTVKKEMGEGGGKEAPVRQDLEGRDMMMALEENIENKLHSSLSSLLQDQRAHSKEDLSLVASLALENKVNDALASVGKDPSSALTFADTEAILQQQRLATEGREANSEQQPGPALYRLVQSQDQSHHSVQRQNDTELGDNQTVVETVAESLPPPDQTIDSISKPRLPPPEVARLGGQPKPSANTNLTADNVSLSSNDTADKNLSSITSNDTSQSGSAVVGSSQLTNVLSIASLFGNGNTDTSQLRNMLAGSSLPINTSAQNSGKVLLYPAGPLPLEASMKALSPEERQTLKGNVLQAEVLFQTSFDLLQKEMSDVLHIHVRPSRKKILGDIEPGIQRWGHTIAWTMVKQVCKDAIRRAKTTGFSWQEWSLWSPCTATCGPQGYQIRHRTCQPLRECLGSNYDLRPCPNQPQCQGPPVWKDWAHWGACSVTCGAGGVQFRTRTCVSDNPILVCQGSGAETITCTPPPCAPVNNTNTSIHQNPKDDHHPKKKPAHSHARPSHRKTKKNHSDTTTTTPKPPTSPTSTRKPHRRKRKRRPERRRKTLPRRPRWPAKPPPNHLETLSVLDSVVDDLEGVQEVKELGRRKLDMIPMQALDSSRLTQVTLAPEQSRPEDLADISWSVWGMWSECSVSCDKGTEFRRRQCIRRKEDTMDGQPVKTKLCPGESKDRRMCALLPCPISVAIPRTLAQLSEGRVGRLVCRHHLKGQVRHMYWITPGQDMVTNSSEDGKYVMLDNTLTIHRALKSDLGLYYCVLVGFSNIYAQKLNKSVEGQYEKEDVGSCLENPCDNGGSCEDDSNNLGPYAHIAAVHYHCICAEGFFGKHCEQKSLVHQYTPNLKIMGVVLVSMIGLLFLTCTSLCLYYWIEGKRRGPVDLGPVMTRRRSEDQWRKMKSFDHKTRSRKQSFSAKAIRRLSRMLTGKEAINEAEHPTVKFGLNTSPYSELAASLGEAEPGNSVQDLENDLTSGIGVNVTPEDITQNASPPTVDEGESECESCVEVQGSHTHPTDYPHSNRRQQQFPYNARRGTGYMGTERARKYQDSDEDLSEFQYSQRLPADFQNNRSSHCDDTDSYRCETEFQEAQRPHTELQDNPNHIVIKLHDSQLYVDFQGNQRHVIKLPSKQELQESEKRSVLYQDSQREPVQPQPSVIYSDDRMEIFSDSNLRHTQGLEDRLKKERYSPFLGSSGESLPNPTTYIYRSQGSMDPQDVNLSSCPSSVTYQPRRKRHSKKWPRQRSSAEYEFNQNNSDDSNDGNYPPSGQTEGEGRGARAPRPSEPSSTPGERGHQYASHYSSAESGEDSDSGQEGGCGRGRGARPKEPRGPWHTMRDCRPRTSTADTPARDGQDNAHSHPGCASRQHHRHDTSCPDGTDTGRTMMYEVRHPDEPYPFRLARSRRKSRERAEDASPCSSGEIAELSASDDSVRRVHDAHSASGSAQVSMNADVHQQRPAAVSHTQLHYLEGGGEGALAPVRTESRKSGRDMLLRKAMENSYIQATTGQEPWKSVFRNRKRSASPDPDQNGTSDPPTGSHCGHSEHPVTGSEPESLSTPSISHGRRRELQPCPASCSQPTTDTNHHHPIGHHLLEGSMVTHFTSPPVQSNSHFPRTPTISYQGHKMNTHGSKTLLNYLKGHNTDKCDAAGRFNFTKEADVSSDSFNLFCPRPNAFEAGSDSPSASNRGPRFSHLNAASTPQETKRTGHDRAAEVDAMRTPVTSPGEGGNVWRQACPMTKTKTKGNGQSQPLANNQLLADRWLESSPSKDQASTSAWQDSPSGVFGQCGMSDCLHRSQTKRILKSALKQRCSQSKLAAVEMKTQPSRRVSFSEPHIHVHNSMDSVLDEDRHLGLNWNSEVSMERYHLSARSAENDPSVDHQHENNSQRLGAFRHINTLSTALPSSEHMSKPTRGADSFKEQWSSSSNQTGSGGLFTFFPSRQRALGHSSHPTTADAHTSGLQFPGNSSSSSTAHVKTSDKSAVVRHADMTAEREGHSLVQNPLLLVDIEPDSSTDRQMATHTGTKAAPPPPLISSDSLPAPLTPCLAADNPRRADPQPRIGQCDVGAGGGEGCWRREEAAEGGPEGPVPAPEGGARGTMSFGSFQEMLTVRSPGAFFRPIDGNDTAAAHHSHH